MLVDELFAGTDPLESMAAGAARLAPGLIAGTNGIAMPGEQGFPPPLIRQAQALHARLTGFLSPPPAAPVQGASGG